MTHKEANTVIQRTERLINQGKNLTEKQMQDYMVAESIKYDYELNLDIKSAREIA